MQYTQHENETGESLAESTQKLFPIDARTVQYFGECLLYNSNSIPEFLMTFDYTDINLIVTALTSSGMDTLGHRGTSVNQEDLYQPLTRCLKKATPPRSQGVLSLCEEWLTNALHKQERLTIAIVLKEGYVASLRSSLNNWSTLYLADAGEVSHERGYPWNIEIRRGCFTSSQVQD